MLIRSDADSARYARFVVGIFDMKFRRLVTPTPEWLHALDFSDRYQAQGTP